MTQGVKIVEIRKKISKNFEGKRKVYDRREVYEKRFCLQKI